MIRVVPTFGSSRYDQRQDVCKVNIGVTLALVLTVILITVQAYRFLKWLISKIRLAITARFPAVDPDDDDDDDSFFDNLDGKEVDGSGDGTADVTGAGDGLTQEQVNEGATITPVGHNTTTLEPAENDASHDEGSTTENHVTNEPASSASEHEGDSPVTSNSSVLGLTMPAVLMRDPLLRSPSAPLRRRVVEQSPPSNEIGARLQRASSSPGSLFGGSNGTTNADPVDLTGGSHVPARIRFMEPNVVVMVRCPARLPAPSRVLPPPVAALSPPPPVVVLPPLPPLAAVPPLRVWVDHVDESAPNTLCEDTTFSRTILANRNFRSNWYALSLVSGRAGDRRDLAQQSGVSENILVCPPMEDRLLHHVRTFRQGLDLAVIPFHSEALHGVDWVTNVIRDSPVEPANVRNRTNHFEAWVMAKHGVNLTELPSKKRSLPSAWYGSKLFTYLHEYLVGHLPFSSIGTGLDQARFNTWHCWLHQMFEKFFPLLRRFQEPTLELHFLISNQQYKTDL